MANPRQLRSLIFGPGLCAATALAIAFMLMVVVTQSAQAQTFKVLHNFSGGSDGAAPAAGVTLDKAGNLYGTAYGGGYTGGNCFPGGCGTVYKLTPKGSGWTVNPLYIFTGSGDGDNPEGEVIFGPNGTLYGTASGFHYPNNIIGTVFNLRPALRACQSALCPWTETTLFKFDNSVEGLYPLGSVIFDQAGNIYGTTDIGGVYDLGTVYKLTPSGGGWTEKVLYNFSGPDGTAPKNGVIFDNAGNLYGTTSAGGYGYGTVFELSPSGSVWKESCLYTFDPSDGYAPYAGLISDQSGNFYGATLEGGTGGGGTVFELTLGANCGWKLKTLHSFGNYQCGPRDNLGMDAAGNLYGTTRCEGAYNFGNVFKLTPSDNGWTYTSLHDFTGGSDGANPYSNVVFDTSGNLYGTAYAGGSQGLGVVWEITP